MNRFKIHAFTLLCSVVLISCGASKNNFLKQKFTNLKPISTLDEVKVAEDIIATKSAVSHVPKAESPSADTLIIRSGEVFVGDIKWYDRKKHRYTFEKRSGRYSEDMDLYTVKKVKYDEVVQVDGKDIELPVSVPEEKYLSRKYGIKRTRDGGIRILAFSVPGALLVIGIIVLVLVLTWFEFFVVVYGTVGIIAALTGLVFGLIFGIGNILDAQRMERRLNRDIRR